MIKLSKFPTLCRVIELHAQLAGLKLVEGWKEIEHHEPDGISTDFHESQFAHAELDAADFADKPISAFVEDDDGSEDALETLVGDPSSQTAALLIESTASESLEDFIREIQEGDMSIDLFV